MTAIYSCRYWTTVDECSQNNFERQNNIQLITEARSVHGRCTCSISCKLYYRGTVMIFADTYREQKLVFWFTILFSHVQAAGSKHLRIPLCFGQPWRGKAERRRPGAKRRPGAFTRHKPRKAAPAAAERRAMSSAIAGRPRKFFPSAQEGPRIAAGPSRFL